MDTNLSVSETYIIENLDRAITEGWIDVYYQPIIRAANGSVCNEESLARWIDPEKGMIEPSVFVPVLERSGLIYKLDLYIIEKVLKDTSMQAIAGLHVLPQTVNISAKDFACCDMLSEINKRLAAAGVGPERFVIEIRESAVAADPDHIRLQLDRFREAGFQIWMDEFGMGYSSLDCIQTFNVDAVKLDMRYVQRININKTRVILTALVKMATDMGVDTIAVGVETKEQADFLNEIGCSKQQGFYYCQPIPLSKIVERYEQGKQIGFENPAESEYYENVGKISLYDLDNVISDDNSALQKFFDAIPIAVLENDGDKLYAVRCNQSYRNFLEKAFSISETGRDADHSDDLNRQGSGIFNVISQAHGQTKRILFEEKIGDVMYINAFLRHIADNPLTGVSAYSIAILSINENAMSGVTFARVARALSADYINLYYVDLDDDSFIEYNPDAERADLSVERHGEDFFNASRNDATAYIYAADRDKFLDSFTKRIIIDAIDNSGTFTLSYRLMINGESRYVNMKAVRMDDHHIIIGVNDVDAYMRRMEAIERVREEQATYARITALSGEYIAIYSVDPETGEYVEYNASSSYENLGLAKTGINFFEETRRLAVDTVHPEDVGRLANIFTKENVIREIEASGLFEMNYRLMLQRSPVYVSLRAAMIDEKDGPRIVVGVSNIDERVRRDMEYSSSLQEAKEKANVDALTGVKNKHAYVDLELELNSMIDNDVPVEFAIIVLDLNGLKAINDAHGHQTGDNFLKAGCHAICDIFDHSPVFRVGGDEFAVVARNRDYEHLDELMGEMHLHNARCIEKRKNPDTNGSADKKSKAARMTVEAGQHVRSADQSIDLSGAEAGEIYDFMPEDVVIACGMARYEGDRSVAAVFDRADLAMYENKKMLKGLQNVKAGQ
ncbi:MAG: GGDEF domain-containing protein [Mogibacterium sp.]|nr:GGDEF domain-containing protein [Mogibacterium sp.]